VNMSDVENMALVLSKASKSVADLKARFPSLQESVKGMLTNEMDQMMTEERFLKEEPERLESALKRCKKLTGTLVTLKRLASVQEQRMPVSFDSEGSPVAGGGAVVNAGDAGGVLPPMPNAKANNRYLKQGWKWSSHFKQVISDSEGQVLQSPGMELRRGVSWEPSLTATSQEPPLVRKMHSMIY